MGIITCYYFQVDTNKYPGALTQGLRASSLQFTSPLEFNAIFRYGFPLRVDLNG